MPEQDEKQTNNVITSINESIISVVRNAPTMPHVDSETQVLAFLAEHQIPLKPMQVYGGLVHTRTISFKYRTVQNKLQSLSEEGYVDRVEIDADEGTVTRIGDDEADRRAAYLITEAGIEELETRL